MSPLPPPNYTQAPNVLLDELLPEIKSLAELKVTLVVVRHTIGWHESESKLSLADLEQRTGMSRQSVIDGIKKGLERGTLERRIEGPKGAEQAFYTLNLASQDSGLGLVQNLDQDRSNNLTSASQGSGPGTYTRAQETPERKQVKKTTPPDPLASEGERAKWEAFLGDIEARVPEVQFHSLFKPLELVEVREGPDGRTLVLRAPDGPAGCLRDRWIDMLDGAAAVTYGSSTSVEVLMSETERRRREQAEDAVAARRRPRRRRAS